MRLSDTGLDLIKSFEGYLVRQPDGSCRAYRCPANVWTCGWGCTEGVGPNTHWTKDEASARLRDELEKHEAAVLRLVKVPLNQHQFDALVSFSYNVGVRSLERSTLLRHLNAGDVARAASHFADWKRAGGKVLPGLVRRRAAEAEMFMRDVVAPMPQKIDVEATKMKPVEAAAKVAAPAVVAVEAVRQVTPPDLTVLTQWQSFGGSIAELIKWASANPIGVVAAVAVFIAVAFLPKLRRS